MGIYGGAAFILASNFRESSGDIDAVVIPSENIDEWNSNIAFMEAAAEEVCKRRNWPADWLNNNCKVFISPKVDYDEGLEYLGAFPNENRPGIRAYVPNKEYIMGMKLKACRVAAENKFKDLNDIISLMILLKPDNEQELVKLGIKYYPELRFDGKLHSNISFIWSKYQETVRNGMATPPRYPVGTRLLV